MNYPQLDYGQGNGAWNPATREPVYQVMERARQDQAFARLFAADILFGRQESGDHYWTYETVDRGWYDGNEQWVPNPVVELTRKSCDWLYNKNTLNASKSWVPLAFGPPAAWNGQNWLAVAVLVEGSNYGFYPETAVHGDLARMLGEGNVAFWATGYNGIRVGVPYAAGFVPMKGGRGRIEAGNSKRA